MDAGARSAAPAATSSCARADRPDGEGEPCGDGVAQRGRLRLGEQEDRGVDAVVTQLDALVDEGDAERARPAVEQGARDRARAVAVAVGLDDRAELGGSDERRQRRGVVCERGDVHLGPRRAATALDRHA